MSFQGGRILTPVGEAAVPQESLKLAYFNKTTKLSGITINYDNNTPHSLSQEQSLVIRDLEKLLTMDISYPSNVKEFAEGVRELCAKEERFKKALRPTVLDKPEEIAASRQQDSVFRILLNVVCLQEELVELLVEEITKRATLDHEDTSWLYSLLNAFRYLPYVKNPEPLTTKLLDVLDVATLPSQIEILHSLPEIIPCSQRKEAAKQLCALLKGGEGNIAGVVIDCLTCFNLRGEVRDEVQALVLSLMADGTTSPGNFPVFFEFLVADCRAQGLTAVLLKCRDALEGVLRSPSDEGASERAVVVARLHQTALRAVGDAWVNLMAGFGAACDHKPVDVLILWVVHATTKARRRSVENLIRKHVKLGVLRVATVRGFFDRLAFPFLLEGYLSSAIAVGACVLSRPRVPFFADFASVYYEKLLGLDFANHFQRQEVLNSLVVLMGANKQNLGPILSVLDYLSGKNAEAMASHAGFVMRILDYLDDCGLDDTKRVFEILCRLVCRGPPDERFSGLKDEIVVLVQKQSSSWKPAVRRKGIVASVVVAKHLASASTTGNDAPPAPNDSVVMSVADMPEGLSKEAADLLEATGKSADGGGGASFKGLFYDELSSLLLVSPPLDALLVRWMNDAFTEGFLNVYVVEAVPDPKDGLRFSEQHSLNAEEEIAGPIYVDVGGLASRGDATVVTLAAFFRLLRNVNYRHSGSNLSGIDALLGCGVIMPVLDDLDDLEPRQLKQAANCVFHCINWFRELVNGFAANTFKNLRHKVLKRVGQLVALENLLREIMKRVPEHELPPSYFRDETDAAGGSKRRAREVVQRPKKKFKADETVPATGNATEGGGGGAKRAKGKKVAPLDIAFREMDPDAVRLLKYRICFGDADQGQARASQPSPATAITAEQFNFLLGNLVGQLKKIAAGGGVTPPDFICDCSYVLPAIKTNFAAISGRLKELVEAADGVHDSGLLYTEEAFALKRSFALVLECFAGVFGWPGFRNDANAGLLKDCLGFGRKPSQLVSLNRQVNDFVDFLCAHSDRCLHVEAAVDLIRTVRALLAALNDSPVIRKKMISVCKKMLMVAWFEEAEPIAASGGKFNASVEFLVSIYLAGADIDTLSGLVGTLQAEAPGVKLRDDRLPMLPSVGKGSFHVLYKAICCAFLAKIQAKIDRLTNSQHLVLWKAATATLQGLISVVKSQPTRNNLMALLKLGVGVLKIFLSHGVPVLEIELRSKSDRVVEIFKAMQAATRFLHHACCESKMKNDAGLVALVPQFRRTLEALIYRVKAALAANDCSSAFWMGNLKNKDTHGEEILSQCPSASSVADEEESASSEGDVDDGDDEEIDLGVQDDRCSSASEIV